MIIKKKKKKFFEILIFKILFCFLLQRHSSDLETQVKQLSNQITMNEQLVMKLETELKDLRLENERLADQLVSTKERVAGDGQEIFQQNGELNGKVSS